MCVCVCVLTTVCVHLDVLNAEHNFRVWVTILGHTSLHFHFTHHVVTIVLSLFTDRLIFIELFITASQQCPSMRNVRCQTYTAISNHSSGHLFPSLQSATPTQTEHYVEGG